MDKQLLERIVLDEKSKLALFGMDKLCVDLVTRCLARIDAERGKDAVAWFINVNDECDPDRPLYQQISKGFEGCLGTFPLFLSPTIPEGYGLVSLAALRMALNALRRDAQEGKSVRGEIADEIERSHKENAMLTDDTCWCESCRPVVIGDMRMVLCPTCGNKRCPHAADHRNQCTGSNEVGQVGSIYQHAARAIEAEVLHAQEPVAQNYWRDVSDELPKEAQEVLFVRDGKTKFGAWIGGIFWHSNEKMVAAKWMPLPSPDSAPQPPALDKLLNDFAITCAFGSADERVSTATAIKSLFAAPQPTAPCPKCAQYEIDFALEHDDKIALQAKAAILDGLSQDAIDGGWTYRGIEAYAKGLEGKVAEQSAEIERLNSAYEAIDEQRNRYFETIAQQAERIAEQAALIEKCRNALLEIRGGKLDYRTIGEALAAIAAQKQAVEHHHKLPDTSGFGEETGDLSTAVDAQKGGV